MWSFMRQTSRSLLPMQLEYDRSQSDPEKSFFNTTYFILAPSRKLLILSWQGEGPELLLHSIPANKSLCMPNALPSWFVAHDSGFRYRCCTMLSFSVLAGILDGTFWGTDWGCSKLWNQNPRAALDNLTRITVRGWNTVRIGRAPVIKNSWAAIRSMDTWGEEYLHCTGSRRYFWAMVMK